MDIIYYKIPLQLTTAMEGNDMQTCTLRQSIEKNLELIITSRFGEHRNDTSYGCEIWDLDFELIVSTSRWEEKLRQSLLQSIMAHEHRLSDVAVSIVISDIEKFNIYKNYKELKKRVDIRVTGTIHKTGEPFGFPINLLLSPLSVD